MIKIDLGYLVNMR